MEKQEFSPRRETCRPRSGRGPVPKVRRNRTADEAYDGARHGGAPEGTAAAQETIRAGDEERSRPRAEERSASRGEPRSPVHGEPRSPMHGELRSPVHSEERSPVYGEQRSASRRKVPGVAQPLDLEVVLAILDAGFVAHVAFVHDDHPLVVPMVYVRKDRELLLHAAASAMLEIGTAGVPVSACVTILDGLVYGRSALDHAVNHRSVVVLGRARDVTADDAKRAFLDMLVDRVAPGRASAVCKASDQELRAIRVLALPIEAAHAKVRSGGPIDDRDGVSAPVWTGHLPVAIRAMSHIPTPDDARHHAMHELPVRPLGID